MVHRRQRLWIFRNRISQWKRNKIRNRLIPLLAKDYNKNIKEVLCNMAQGVGCDYDYLSMAAQKAMKEPKPKINLKQFVHLHPAMQRLTIRFNIAKVKGDTRRLTFQHIKEVEDLVFHRPVNSVVDLPKGVSVVKKKNSLIFYRR